MSAALKLSELAARFDLAEDAPLVTVTISPRTVDVMAALPAWLKPHFRAVDSEGFVRLEHLEPYLISDSHRRDNLDAAARALIAAGYCVWPCVETTCSLEVSPQETPHFITAAVFRGR